jgi:hypothetical protein
MQIGLQYIRVCLRGEAGEAPTGDRFLGVFEPEPSLFEAGPTPEYRFFPSQSAWQAALIELVVVDMRELSGFKEPSEEFAARVERGFTQAAEWLSRVGTGGLARWRAEGRQADISVGGWLANEQLDLCFPAAFLRECGRLGLPIRICTND